LIDHAELGEIAVIQHEKNAVARVTDNLAGDRVTWCD
jgi:hypothetical protein